VTGNIFTQYIYNGTTNNIFALDLTGLNTRQMYTARAYVTTPGGTTYGQATSFDSNYANRIYVADGLVFKPAVYALDEYYQGGRIFYLVGAGEYNLGYDPYIPHCFVVNTAPFAYDVPWGDALVACQNATIAGYNDWEAVGMPNEVIAYKNAYPNRFLYPNAAYWTAVNAGTDTAWAYNLGTGTVFPLDDDNLLDVLAQRFI
jgi:hypothetical protein